MEWVHCTYCVNVLGVLHMLFGCIVGIVRMDWVILGVQKIALGVLQISIPA